MKVALIENNKNNNIINADVFNRNSLTASIVKAIAHFGNEKISCASNA